jgi:TonB-linked SusC/RagA family outer membrane protein
MTFNLENKIPNKIPNKMQIGSSLKIARLLLLLSALLAGAGSYAQSERVTIQLSDAPVRAILRAIEEQSLYRFFYSSDLAYLNQKISINAVNRTVASVLDEALKGSNLSYKMAEKNLITISAVDPQPRTSRNISGVVLDGGGEPLAGASVVVKGTTAGALTGVSGDYSLQASDGDVLVFSFMGLTSMEEAVGERSRVDVQLSEATRLIDEVVVVGYGVQKKSVVTAAISRVTAEDLNTANPSRVEDVLKGKVSGVQITQSSGHLGAASQVRIRGIGTINNSDPLYIVDGMAVDGGIDYLNPVDIQSVEILKDAASAAIYGARAANGVVLVTTKSGQAGKAVLSYDFSVGWQNPWKKMDMLNAEEYMMVMNEASLNDGGGLKYSRADMDNFAAQSGQGTDWQKEVFDRNAPVQNHQVSVSGGSEKSSYFASFGYFSQDGIVGGSYGKSNYDRYSLRANSKYTAFETDTRSFLSKVALGINAGYSRTEVAGTEPNEQYSSVLINALSASPLMSVYADEAGAAAILASYPYAVKDADGRVFDFPEPGHQMLNPVAMLNQPAYRTDNSDKFVASLFAELDVLPGLKFKSSYGADLSFWGFDAYNYRLQMGGSMDKLNSAVEGQMNRGLRWQLENVLTYAATFAEKHNLNAVLGQSAQQYRYRYLYGARQNLIDETDPIKATIDNTATPSALTDLALAGGIGNVDYSALASYFGRLDYNFDERYMIEATLRRDGSSRFGPNNKWALFPAVSVGWNALNEPYMQGYKPIWLNTLKLRFSWGKNGNENIPDLSYTAFIQPGADYYLGRGYDLAAGSETPVQSGLEAARIANPSVRWEESEQTDIGLDARFFGNALSLGFDYFIKKTNGMLIDRPIPDYAGLAAPIANVGDMENRGFEIEIGWKHSVSQLRYYASANASYICNTLVNAGTETGSIELSVQSQVTGNGISFVRGTNGKPYPYFYGYVTDGIFQTDDEARSYVGKDGKPMQPNAKRGDVRFKDTDDDGDVDPDDRTYIGKGTPDWTFGCSLGADWKGIDLSLFLQGVAGNDMFDLTQRSDLATTNRPAWTLDRWTTANPGSRLPRLTSLDPNTNRRPSDLYVKDGSYLRLKNIQLGYTLPARWTRVCAVAKLRVFVMAENLLTLTAYDGFDPESATGSYYNIGVDRGIYPQAKTFSVGANIAF